MPEWLRVFGSRWGTWWVLACVVTLFVVSGAGDSCRGALAKSEECTGFKSTAYEDGGTISAVIFVAMLVGGVGLGRLQHLSDTRRCPRCGERVVVGSLECRACEFDFRTVGQ